MSDKNVKFVKKVVNEIVERHMINGCVNELESRRAIAEALVIGNQAAVFHNFEGVDAREVAEEIIDGRDNSSNS